MKKLRFLNRIVGTSFAFLALSVAQLATTQMCFIFYQEEIPEKVKELKKEK